MTGRDCEHGVERGFGKLECAGVHHAKHVAVCHPCSIHVRRIDINAEIANRGEHRTVDADTAAHVEYGSSSCNLHVFANESLVEPDRHGIQHLCVAEYPWMLQQCERGHSVPRLISTSCMCARYASSPIVRLSISLT